MLDGGLSWTKDQAHLLMKIFALPWNLVGSLDRNKT